MHRFFIMLFLLAIPFLSSAKTVPELPPFGSDAACSGDNQPKNFTISSFRITNPTWYNATDDYYGSGAPSLEFYCDVWPDSMNDTGSPCYLRPFDKDNLTSFHTCKDPNLGFLWDGNNLTVGYDYSCSAPYNEV